jgi:hypothetical protein
MTEGAFSVDDHKRKIAALLAKAERTDNEAEQRAYTEKAERMMVRLGIDAAELQAAGARTDDIVEESRVWTTIYAPAVADLAFTVGLAFGDLNFLQSRTGKDRVRTYVIGHESDVAAYLTLLDSLHLQVFSALKAFRRETRGDRRWNTIHENFVVDRSFVRGYGRAVADRLRAIREEVREEAAPTMSSSTALVLASKQDRVDAWQDERYPKLGKARAGRSQSSWAGHAAGTRAGQRASLGGKGIGGQRAVGR